MNRPTFGGISFGPVNRGEGHKDEPVGTGDGIGAGSGD